MDQQQNAALVEEAAAAAQSPQEQAAGLSQVVSVFGSMTASNMTRLRPGAWRATSVQPQHTAFQTHHRRTQSCGDIAPWRPSSNAAVAGAGMSGRVLRRGLSSCLDTVAKRPVSGFVARVVNPVRRPERSAGIQVVADQVCTNKVRLYPGLAALNAAQAALVLTWSQHCQRHPGYNRQTAQIASAGGANNLAYFFEMALHAAVTIALTSQLNQAQSASR
jgi:hypothetical protein